MAIFAVYGTSVSGSNDIYGGVKLSDLTMSGDVTFTGGITINNSTDKISGLTGGTAANEALAYAQSGASLAGLTLTDILTTNSNITFTAGRVTGLPTTPGSPMSGDALAYGQTNASLAGLTMTGAIAMGGSKITGGPGTAASITADTDFATKVYVDSLAMGLAWKDAARVATTATLTATYDNGSSGVGATLTNSGAPATIGDAIGEGISLVVDDRVLVKNQTTSLQNGIYKVTTVGNAVDNWVLTRATDADSTTDLDAAAIFVTEGSTNADKAYVQTADNVIIGTDDITFTQFSGSGSAETLAQTLISGKFTGANATTSGNDIVFSGAVAQDSIKIGGVSGTSFGISFSSPASGAGGAIAITGQTAAGDNAGGSISLTGGTGGTGGTSGVGGGISLVGGTPGSSTGAAAGALTFSTATGATAPLATVGGAGGSLTASLGTGGTSAAGASAAAAGAGGSYTFTAGTGGAGTAGGAVGEASDAGSGGSYTVTAGTGGAGASGVDSADAGAGGSVSITAGNAGAVSGGAGAAGGSVTFTAGDGTGAAAAGDANLFAGMNNSTGKDGDVKLRVFSSGGGGANGMILFQKSTTTFMTFDPGASVDQIIGASSGPFTLKYAGAGAGAGAAINIEGQIGAATSDGGVVTITAGDGGSTSGNGGLATLRGGSATDGNGGGVAIIGRNGATTGAGGAITLTGGNAAGGSTDGGSITLTGGTGGATDGAGGDIVLNAGPGSGTGKSGDIRLIIETDGSDTDGVIQFEQDTSIFLTLRRTTETFFELESTAGAFRVQYDAAHASSTGSAVSITAQTGASGSAGGALTLTAGAGAGASGTGGAASLNGGAAGTTTAVGGAASLTGGAGGSTSGAGGAVSLTGGAATSGAGGAVSLTGGAGGTAGAGGAISIAAGASASSATTGGAVTMTAAAPGTADGTGGSVSIAAGGTTGAGTGGNITLTAGDTSSGTDGSIFLVAGGSTKLTIGSTLTSSVSLSMSSTNKITNLADGTAASDAINLGQLQAAVGEYFTGTAQTDDTTETNLIVITPTDLKTVSVLARVSGYRNDATDEGASYLLHATFRRDGTTTTIIGSTSVISQHEDVPAWNATIDASGSDIRVRVTGVTTSTFWKGVATVIYSS
jgi:hypothetical protein